MNKYLEKIASDGIHLGEILSKAKSYATPKNLGIAAGATGLSIVAGKHLYNHLSTENKHVAKTFAESTAASIPMTAAGMGAGGYIGSRLGSKGAALGAVIGGHVGGSLAELGAIKHNAVNLRKHKE